MKNFAIVGAAGFVASRHLDAIRAGGHRLVAAVDPCDSVGLLDRYSFEAKYFREMRAFAAFLEAARRGPAAGRVDFVSICSPNDLHEEHLGVALRGGADAICEKPLVVDPERLAALEELERETGRRIYTVLQLRHHPELRAFRERLGAGRGGRARVDLTYITARGPWYDESWKGSEERSGGIVINVGIHFFDLLLWLFGPAEESGIEFCGPRRAAGSLRLERADVRWFLSLDREDLPPAAVEAGETTFRSLTADGVEIRFSSGIVDLHRPVYEAVVAGEGCGIEDARPALELAHAIRVAAAATPLRESAG